MPATHEPCLLDVLHAAQFVESFAELRLASVGLSLPKLAALNRLVEAGDSLPLGQLAERLACVKSNVTQLVDRLEVDGLVSRALDPHDRRSRLAVITDAGRDAYERGRRIYDEAERELLSALTATESIALAEILGKLERRSREGRDVRTDCQG